MTATFQTVGQFATQNARKYMTQLCKHFAHKVPAEVEGDQGHVTFAMGTAKLHADDSGLTVQLSADSEAALAQMRPIIDDHLTRFAFREDFLSMNWSAPAAAD
ncbi:DUF2218 domain-containing protein [Paracoccus sp. R12_1]|uniref:DUF2218 domain-containing protein n=1 Tax=unclassified Paracoccus (in: a-proteobacteria) TaxID=2688777 RepID=UPI000C0A7EB2|nr:MULTISPECIES: DUF2218 domain-containing protein [unclassified Paracoccus (in: a-proteobacteria)]MBO9456726.1 DUF2218 domain-containing protein [Paracoccus sp. R12_2]MBO9487822.1 DUF2218 domain-containing protein [Paracoccus sp. R12_1]PHQ68723.1 MAG: 2,4-dihydroxyhept-2-ene-1,7-dioic acid aldolase [Paracoccus sp. (in: a-proteobacteria)]